MSSRRIPRLEKTIAANRSEAHMSEIDGQDLSGVAETLLITLYLRAMESQRPDALIKMRRP